MKSGMDKKDMIIVGGCVVLLFMWFVQSVPKAPQPRPGPGTDEIVTDPTGQGPKPHGLIPTISPAPGDPPAPQPDPGTGNGNAGQAPPAYAAIAWLPKEMAETYEALTPASDAELKAGENVTFKISPDDGGILTATMFEYLTSKDSDDPIEVGGTFPIGEIQNEDGTWTFSHAQIARRTKNSIRSSRWIKQTSLILEQTWTLVEGKDGSVKYQFTLTNEGETTQKAGRLRLHCASMPPLAKKKGAFGGMVGVDQRIDTRTTEGKIKKKLKAKIKKMDPDDHRELLHQNIQWMAVQNQFFAVIATSDNEFTGYSLEAEYLDKEKTGKKDPMRVTGYAYMEETTLAPGESRSWTVTYYIGPKHFDRLKALGQSQERVMELGRLFFGHLGWMEWISRFILWCLIKLQGMVNNYGFAIIIITLSMRIVFWPVNHKSTMWSRKLQELQPEFKALKEEHKDNPQLFQQKTLELYKKHKLNPIMGCLPMLIQIPVFFGLFNVLRSSIQLRHAGFLWVTDLSVQDTVGHLFFTSIPINPLAIMMAGTWLVQLKVMPTSADPAQQKMMMIMTSVIVLMIYTMPSGLTLYWTMSQMASISQYVITNKFLLPPKPASA